MTFGQTWYKDRQKQGKTISLAKFKYTIKTALCSYVYLQRFLLLFEQAFSAWFHSHLYPSITHMTNSSQHDQIIWVFSVFWIATTYHEEWKFHLRNLYLKTFECSASLRQVRLILSPTPCRLSHRYWQQLWPKQRWPLCEILKIKLRNFYVDTHHTFQWIRKLFPSRTKFSASSAHFRIELQVWITTLRTNSRK